MIFSPEKKKENIGENSSVNGNVESFYEENGDVETLQSAKKIC